MFGPRHCEKPSRCCRHWPATAFALLAALLSPAIPPAVHGSERVVPLKELRATPAQERATRIIVDLMQRYEYKKVPLDDALSSRILDRYLKTLDPNKSFFLAHDVAQFEQYRQTLDDALRHARLAPAFEIFRRFRERMKERADKAALLLKREFDFERDETYHFDREDAAWADGPEVLDELWRKRVKNDALELRLAGRKPGELRKTLRKRYARMSRRIAQFNANDVYQFFVNAYTTSIEPHTSYFSPRTSENFKIRMSLSLEGIGAALQTEKEYTIVRRIIRGGPAQRSKQLHVGDRIVGVGQGPKGEMVDVVSWRLEDVVDLIRGPKNTVVRLDLLPEKALPGDRTQVISLVRDRINLEERAAKQRVLEIEEGDRTIRIGVVNVPTFYLDSQARARGATNYRSTTRDVRRLLEELAAENVAGIIVDLRNNSGGSLIEATDLTGLFIESGPVVQIRDSRGRIQVNRDPDPTMAYRGPLAVLIDRRSASASEIFAAALQDYHRAVLLGEPTFGKGTVQNLFDLDRRGGLGQLKVTIAQFFRVNGESTQHRGVIPDVLFETAVDAQSHGERALDNALPWASIRPARFRPVEAEAYDFSAVRRRHRERVAHDPRFQLLLEELEAAKRTRKVKDVSLVLSKREAEREARKEAQEARERRMREALGLPNPDTRTESKGKQPEGTRAPADNESKSDPVLDEAARVLIDILEHRKSPPAQSIAVGIGPFTGTAAPAR